MTASKKLLLPIQSSHLKLIRQCEVYIMEEAVTDTLIKSAANRVELQKEELLEGLEEEQYVENIAIIEAGTEPNHGQVDLDIT